MPQYVITLDRSDRPGAVSRIEAVFLNRRQVAPNVWVVRDNGPAQDMIKRLALPADDQRSIVIVQLAADYYGWANKQFWDWLAEGFRENVVG